MDRKAQHDISRKLKALNHAMQQLQYVQRNICPKFTGEYLAT
jgi:hypothetical protein